MPRLADSDNEMQQHRLGGHFTFTAKRIEHLGATEYTLVTIAVDETGSVLYFEQELLKMLRTAVAACVKSPRVDNLLIRVIHFSSRYPQGVSEVHGFKSLVDIVASGDPSLVVHSTTPMAKVVAALTNVYANIRPGGLTPLYDAVYSSVGAMNKYGKELTAQDYLANGIAFIITDGDNNDSTATAAMVKTELQKSVTGENLESMISVLIGINAAQYKNALEQFAKDAGITQFIDAGDATEGKLAKLAAFVSQSVSSQSQSLGTGGPSKDIAATI